MPTAMYSPLSGSFLYMDLYDLGYLIQSLITVMDQECPISHAL